ncbi:hypothetical protein G6514_009783 [Epicoccum nigrum]|nr:hypothetical protein G6514_009783 [Epicoccum nigrum]
MRFGRTVYYNFSCSRQEWTSVTIEALPGEASRMEITIPQQWKGRPGCHTYVYLPRLAPLSVHPFSVAWYTNPEDARPDYEKITLSLDDHEVQKGPTTISCIVRARTGMTRALYDRASKAKTGRITLWGAIEGFHGANYSLNSYGTILLFAAGAGITHQIPFVQHLLAGYNHDTTATRRVLLVWCIPDIQCIDWIQPWLEELTTIPNFSDVVQLRLHVSRPTSKPAKALPLQNMADIIFQRCKPQEIVDEQIMAQIGAMAVTVCGPGGFNDSVRAAVRRRVGLRSIDFFEEAFSS